MPSNVPFASQRMFWLKYSESCLLIFKIVTGLQFMYRESDWQISEESRLYKMHEVKHKEVHSLRTKNYIQCRTITTAL